jgi:hypothetical protein
MARGRNRVFRLTLVSILLLLGIPSLGRSAFSLQIREVSSGRVLWEEPVSLKDRFTLVHRNSIYGAQVRERLEVQPDGSLRLTAIQCKAPAVLEYYGLETSSSRWIPMDRRFESLVVLVSRNGAYHLEWGGKRFDLAQTLKDGTTVEIRLIRFRSLN